MGLLACHSLVIFSDQHLNAIIKFQLYLFFTSYLLLQGYSKVWRRNREKRRKRCHHLRFKVFPLTILVTFVMQLLYNYSALIVISLSSMALNLKKNQTNVLGMVFLLVVQIHEYHKQKKYKTYFKYQYLRILILQDYLSHKQYQ